MFLKALKKSYFNVKHKGDSWWQEKLQRERGGFERREREQRAVFQGDIFFVKLCLFIPLCSNLA